MDGKSPKEMYDMISTFMECYGSRKGIDKVVVSDKKFIAYISHAYLVDLLPKTFGGYKVEYVVNTPAFDGTNFLGA